MADDRSPRYPNENDLQASEVSTNYPAQSRQSPLSVFTPEIRGVLASDPEATKNFLSTILQGMQVDQELRRQESLDAQALKREELKLKQIAQEQQHSIAIKKEARSDRESQANTTTMRLVIGAITLAFAGSLGFAMIHKDSTLADKVFTGAMGLLGGAGGVVALGQKKESKNPDQ